MRHPFLAGGALLLLFAGLAAGCATAPASGLRCAPEPAFAAGGERATLWARHSAEYRAATEIVYRAALAALREAIADPAWTAEPAQTGELRALPPAVVMDIDETVLDNSEPQARMLLRETCTREFAALWDDWVAERSAPAVPGAVAFIRAARELRDASGRVVRVFFVTNRECSPREGSPAACPQEADTLANLRALGLDAATLADDLMLKGERPDWESEKRPRRLAVAATHRILLNVGDDLADFLPDVRRADPLARARAHCAERWRWGRQWFLLPNPMYGSWLAALGSDAGVALAAPTPPGCDEG